MIELRKLIAYRKYLAAILAVSALLSGVTCVYACPQHQTKQIGGEKTDKRQVRKVLFIGDSFTGWMAERFNAYGELNDFDVATVVWDGSTISKWGNTPRLKEIVDEVNPDVVFVSLGMNELFELNPQQTLTAPVKKIIDSMGDTPYVWIGPPSWPGHDKGEELNSWLEKTLGPSHFYRSFDLELARQSKTNPHPSRQGIEKWMDLFVKWLPVNTDLNFRSLDMPAVGRMSRGKTFIYKRMKENL